MNAGRRIPVEQSHPDEEGARLYAKRQRIQIKDVKGHYQRLRDASVRVVVALYLVLPWLTWNDRQAILFDLPERRFHIFGLTFWPQDFLFLAWALIISALALFFVTVFAGRVYCGYVCPQTAWTRWFMAIEQFFEGDRHQRIKLDKAPLSLNKVSRRFAKHGLWLVLALATGLTFVGYFTPIRELVPDFFTGQVGGWALFWIGFFTFATYGNAGFMREQVCLYMCPYARFQSVMFDRDTLIVSYDRARGEPRRRGARKHSEEPAGDCVDCGLCVQVCPTGIDIREGLQYECITCAACIDACDQVMERVDRPKGLIRYTTENALNGRHTHLLRPRLIGYGAVILILVGLFAGSLVTRVPLQVDVLRDRNQLYRVTGSGTIENSYRLEILNKAQTPHSYQLTLEGPEGLTLVNGPRDFTLRPGEHRSLPVTVSADPYAGTVESADIRFRVHAVNGADSDAPDMEMAHESRFIAPRS
ncbi:cytochrome c oxidase accessory protein CcoG [Alloalcanivorax profundimaris]|uniref:cytochrome c oxidase accessory protein CcoG n=1 Tax=Alloalcanivorax profundimaris TaxID=2735259 RepID=UPI000C352C3D|nr:cytochrome c oxidase accessory protein CcoG [Alloalcanivorax profundimaris]MBF1800662.1 cytochrome c oxidase accessory protein CcoG [Alloalcanivorax profundimaris]MBM1145348.1 cytochrome c oxidase accessory protein CcoG [Alcanivorax sp. ZXX171]MBU57347.1 cytochrome c oxidase accessory protein CcoG [Alcanivorax sp.]MCQ6263864.1 cytochrome c oxidase accessory protein CcoG [Alcanivorax sp. MM125-6]